MTSLDKRVTKFPGNAVNNMFSKLISGSDSTDCTQMNSLESKNSPEFYSQQRSRPPPLPLKTYSTQQYNPNSSQKKIHRAGAPWQDYNAILTEDQAGEIILAQKSGPEHTLMAIKEIRAGQDECVKRLRNYFHPNLVSLEEIFLSNNIAYMVYEWMDISLTNIQSTCCGQLVSFQIAAICKEVYHLLFVFVTSLTQTGPSRIELYPRNSSTIAWIC